MKHPIIIALLACTLTACNNAPQPTIQPKQELAEALEEKSSYAVSKRGSGDLVENLYNELVEKTPELKKLEDNIDMFSTGYADSTEAFNKYNNSNTSYYIGATNHTNMISDSVLKHKMKELINASLGKYNATVSKHIELLKNIDARTTSLKDMHMAFKIIKTLPVIEKYQKENIPSIMPIEKYLNNLNKTLNTISTMYSVSKP